MKIKIASKVECLSCGSILHSKDVHDYVVCKCGRTSLDGGLEYTKISAPNLNMFIDVSEFADVKKGTVLHTKDGRKIGNGVVIDEDEKYVIVCTDFGNIVRLNEKEILQYFYIGGWVSLDTRMYAQIRKINESKEFFLTQTDFCDDCNPFKEPKCNNCIGG